MNLSPENMPVWNRHGLTMSNGTVTMSVSALDAILSAVRAEGEINATVMPRLKVAEVCFSFGWGAGYESALKGTEGPCLAKAWADSPAQMLVDLSPETPTPADAARSASPLAPVELCPGRTQNPPHGEV